MLLLVIFGTSVVLNAQTKAVSNQTADAKSKAQLKTSADSTAYIYGYSWVQNMIMQGLPPAELFSLEAFIQGAVESSKGIANPLTPAQSEALDKVFQAKMQEIQAKMQEIEAEKQASANAEKAKQSEANKTEGQKFLAENGKRSAVITTASGLQIETTLEGKGKSPKATDKVTVHYTGTLINGTKFDSSVDRGEPASFLLNQVIPGWTEGLQLMKEGGKAKLYIPPNIAYGDNPRGDVIQPGHTLIFEIELIKVEEN